MIEQSGILVLKKFAPANSAPQFWLPLRLPSSHPDNVALNQFALLRSAPLMLAPPLPASINEAPTKFLNRRSVLRMWAFSKLPHCIKASLILSVSYTHLMNHSQHTPWTPAFVRILSLMINQLKWMRICMSLESNSRLNLGMVYRQLYNSFREWISTFQVLGR